MPSEYCTAYAVYLCAGLAALAFIHAESLFSLSVVFLNFPADSAHIFYGDSGILGCVICDNIFRAVCRRDPKQFHLAILWESIYLNDFAA